MRTIQNIKGFKYILLFKTIFCLSIIYGQKVDCLEARKKYLQMYPEVNTQLDIYNSPWHHYLEFGKSEGKIWDSKNCLELSSDDLTKDLKGKSTLEQSLNLNDTLIKDFFIYKHYKKQTQLFNKYRQYKGLSLYYSNSNGEYNTPQVNYLIIGNIHKKLTNSCMIYCLNAGQWADYSDQLIKIGFKDWILTKKNKNYKLYFIYDTKDNNYYFFDGLSLEDQYQNFDYKSYKTTLDIACNNPFIKIKKSKIKSFIKRHSSEITLLKDEDKIKTIYELTNIDNIEEYSYANYYYNNGIKQELVLSSMNRLIEINADYFYWGYKVNDKPSQRGYIIEKKTNKIIMHALWNNGFNIEPPLAVFFYDSMPKLELVNSLKTKMFSIGINNNGKNFYYFGDIKSPSTLWNGNGFLYWEDQSYIGEFEDGERSGYGKYEWSNGNKYEGQFHLGKFEGKGVFTYNSGQYYKGEFSNNKFNGNGIEYNKNNDVIKSGIWSNGYFTKSSNEILKEEKEQQERDVYNNSLLSGKYDKKIETICSDLIASELIYGKENRKKLLATQINNLESEIGHKLSIDEENYFQSKSSTYLNQLANSLELLSTLNKSNKNAQETNNTNKNTNSKWKYKCIRNGCNNIVDQEKTVYHYNNRTGSCSTKSYENGVGTLFYGRAGKGYCSSGCALKDCAEFGHQIKDSEGQYGF